MTKTYHNYDLHPCTKIAGGKGKAFRGLEAIARELTEKIQRIRDEERRGENRKIVVSLDAYPGVDTHFLEALVTLLHADAVLNAQTCVKTEECRRTEFADYITDDRVFGIICHKRPESVFDEEKLAAMRRSVSEASGDLVIVYGTGAGLVTEGDLYLYADMTRWEIQLRYRKGMPNFACHNEQAPILTKYKIGYFIEWRLADRYKKARFSRMDYVLEWEDPENPVMVTGEAFRDGLRQVAAQPFRTEPYFDPGVWGGHWMQEHFDTGRDRQNLAWSFDGVPEENALNMQFGDVVFKAPAQDLVFFAPEALLGARVYGRYGAEFPIRFDLLDTMGGGNLSLQVHPMTGYIQDTFGMHYTQDESYYLLDTDESEETFVYLGLKKGIDRKAMEDDLVRARKGEIPFPAEKYVNRVPVKKHDHVLIPAGTIHCSGKNTMVLEISATPYIFTFKLWDWGRVGLDGLPRPIHLEHGLENIQWDRDTDWIYNHCVHQEKTIRREEGILEERTGLDIREPIETVRYSLERPVTVKTDDSVTVCNLVEGRSVKIQSTSGAFPDFTVHYAETCIIPACVGEFRVCPNDGPVKLIAAQIRR